MKKIIITFIIVMSLCHYGNAQEYKTAAGLRGGYYNGITARHFLSEEVAIEGLLQSRWRSFNITGLYEFQKPIVDIEHLYWYYGFGAHIGFWDGTYAPWGTFNTNYTVIGVDGIIGLEYCVQEYPISISIDWKPALQLIGYTDLWVDAAAVSVRYMFK